MPQRPKRAPNGLVWPITDEKKGERSSTATGKKIWAEAWRPLNAEMAERIGNERKWRFKYSKYVVEHVRASLRNPNDCLAAAKAGLKTAYDEFEFIRDGSTCKLRDAMSKYGKSSFSTGFVKGNLTLEKGKPLEIPYKGRKLSGDALLQQLGKWERYGTIEKDAAEAISLAAQNPEWTDLSDRYFVLLGAGSAMGPFLTLMALGANVIAVDLDRQGIWERLLRVARNSPGTLTFALKKSQEDCKDDADLAANAGSNLLTQAPETCAWLLEQYPDKPLTIGCYVYLDGALHVQVGLACDLIMKELSERRKDVSLAYLCTPTDCHVITAEANQAARKNAELSLRNLLVAPMKLFPQMLVRNAEKPVKADDDTQFYIVNGIVVRQGPNYITAKRLQHWRAIEARSRGCTVASNVAPSTTTASVVSNRMFAWAYDGMPFFKPMEIFDQDTSNAVMAALLINDIRNPRSAANASTELKNPLELFKSTSFNGGVWRCAYQLGSVGETSTLIHFVKVGFLPLMLVIFVLLALKFFY